MVMVKRHLVLFGGFHDSFSGDHTKYFNDVGVFDTDTREWKKIEVKLKSQVAKANAGRVQDAPEDGSSWTLQWPNN